MKSFFCLFIIYLRVNSFECFMRNVYGDIKEEPYFGDPGQPLILTPLIKQKKILEAQQLSKVNFSEVPQIESYSGFLTVNENFNSNLFFWFFPSEVNYNYDPVVLWLQGGPGATSLIGLFTENGPLIVDSNGKLKQRKYSWTKGHSVIYIDNPVGTGYSFTDDNGYAQNETVVGEQLYEGLLQFFQLFPQLQKNEFYVSGESYAGKYVPAISYTIYKNNPSAPQKINLRGLAIGNGLSDPEHQAKYGEYLYQLGLIDSNARASVQQYEQEYIGYIRNKQYLEAFRVFDNLLNGDLTSGSSFFSNHTGFKNYFNYLVAQDTSTIIPDMGKFVQRADVRKTIHVGNAKFHSAENNIVEKHLIEDVMQSVAPWVAELLSNYRVLIYNGQLDIIVAYPLTVNYLKNLQFDSADVYKIAIRHIWYVDNEVAGYAKKAGNLTEVLVRNAGHMVPTDQPRWALDLITRFTRNKKFY